MRIAGTVGAKPDIGLDSKMGFKTAGLCGPCTTV